MRAPVGRCTGNPTELDACPTLGSTREQPEALALRMPSRGVNSQAVTEYTMLAAPQSGANGSGAGATGAASPASTHAPATATLSAAVAGVASTEPASSAMAIARPVTDLLMDQPPFRIRVQG